MESRQSRNSADNGETTIVLYAFSDNRFVAMAGQIVEDYRFNRHSRVKRLTPEHQGRDGTGHFSAIDNQDDRGFGEFRYFSGAHAPLRIKPVLQSAVSLDNGDVRVPCVQLKRRENLISVHKEEVDIITGMTRCPAQPSHVNVIRTFFKRDDPVISCLPQPAEADTDRGFSGVSSETGNHESRAGSHLLGPGISKEVQEPLLQLFAALVAFPLPDRAIFMVLNIFSTSEELHFGHFISNPSFPVFSFKSSKTCPHV